jgi:hypothetical protein
MSLDATRLSLRGQVVSTVSLTAVTEATVIMIVYRQTRSADGSLASLHDLSYAAAYASLSSRLPILAN